MLGFIVCGHGGFASGMKKALELISGEQKATEFIDFQDGMSSEELADQYQVALDDLQDNDEVIILTDILGGTPYNQAVYLTETNQNVKVISGTNLPMLLEREFKRDLSGEQFVNSILEAGKSAVVSYDRSQNYSSDDDE